MKASSRGRSWGQWIQRLSFLGGISAFWVALLLSPSRGGVDWVGIAFLVLAWAKLGLDFAIWLRRRARRSTSPPPVVEVPASLQATPPRMLRGELVSRAVKSHRGAYWALVLPALLASAWFRRPEGRNAVFALPVLALVTVIVFFAESNVRAVRRLVREGSVVHGKVVRVSWWWGAPRVTVHFLRDGGPRSISVLLRAGRVLEEETSVPVLVASGSDLAGLVTSSESSSWPACGGRERLGGSRMPDRRSRRTK